MPNCYLNPIHGYWTQEQLQIPHSCINGSINEVCLNCPKTYDTTFSTDGENLIPPKEDNTKNEQNSFKDDDPFDHSWFGRCKMDRPYKNPFTYHLRRPNPCRHRGTMGSLLTRCTNCMPEFFKFFLLSPVGSEKSCFYRLELDPFEKACLTDARNVDKKIPFIRQDLDNRVGHWYESNFDEFGNPVGDKVAKCIQHMLMKRPRIEQYLPYENLDKEWLNNFCDFYGEVVGDEGPQANEIVT